MARILVVDDDPDILKVAEKVLSQADHTVYTAEDAMKAMDLLRSAQFDLLISDANMPHFSGFELVQTIRTNKEYAHMGIAMLTGLRQRKDIDKAIKVGVDDYIIKPIDPLLFLKKVEALFEKRPPMEMPEILLHGPEGNGEPSDLKISTTIVAISELGMRVHSQFKIPTSTVIEMNANIFDQIGIEPPPLKVMTCVESDTPGVWEVKLTFVGAREQMLQKIRKWIFTKNSTRAAA